MRTEAASGARRNVGISGASASCTAETEVMATSARGPEMTATVELDDVGGGDARGERQDVQVVGRDAGLTEGVLDVVGGQGVDGQPGDVVAAP